jgi:hypothetical protein
MEKANYLSGLEILLIFLTDHLSGRESQSIGQEEKCCLFIRKRNDAYLSGREMTPICQERKYCLVYILYK